MSETYPVPAWADRAHVNAETYDRLYQSSIADPEGFWREQAKSLQWTTPFTQVRDTNFAADDLRIRWFADGTLNASVNCVDRHLPAKADTPAILWEG
ncbi:MAG TPA: acetyl-coenzyme A synthetase N-terminal domain-containing protein, partial [Magnetospirillum sp.]|nr:acetyl-coenzyme A synthetase N-terminal domain-containing protein [Magnetospirillum sp.]